MIPLLQTTSTVVEGRAFAVMLTIILDSDLKSTLLEELSVLQRRLNLTTLYVTHDRVEAATFADSIVKMKNGRIDESNLTLMQGVR